MSAPHTQDERGSITILGMFVMGIGCLVVLVIVQLGGLVAQRSQTSAAADAAALAAASELAQGRGGPAAVVAAQQVARANGAVLISCACVGLTAEVEVVKSSSLLGIHELHARAKAGIDLTLASR